MPPCPRAIMLMLAAVRIGAIHSVVFAGFGAKALADRILASGSRLVFSSDVTYRKGKNVQLKQIVDDALETLESSRAPGSGPSGVEHVVVLNRTGETIPMRSPRDVTWSEFVSRAPGNSSEVTRMEANEPAFI